MEHYEISKPEANVVRVALLAGWTAEDESAEMFKAVVQALDECEDNVTLVIAAGEFRPSYKNNASILAHDVLYHENLERIIVVSPGASYAVTHMGAVRGKRGLRPIPILAYDDESQVEF